MSNRLVLKGLGLEISGNAGCDLDQIENSCLNVAVWVGVKSVRASGVATIGTTGTVA